MFPDPGHRADFLGRVGLVQVYQQAGQFDLDVLATQVVHRQRADLGGGLVEGHDHDPDLFLACDLGRAPAVLAVHNDELAFVDRVGPHEDRLVHAVDLDLVDYRLEELGLHVIRVVNVGCDLLDADQTEVDLVASGFRGRSGLGCRGRGLCFEWFGRGLLCN